VRDVARNIEAFPCSKRFIGKYLQNSRLLLLIECCGLLGLRWVESVRDETSLSTYAIFYSLFYLPSGPAAAVPRS
jgi:hypothetical protein